MIEPRKVDKPLVLYGYGKLGHLAEELFKELKIPIAAIIDKNTEWSGDKDYLLAVCVASEPYIPIYTRLKDDGWDDVASVYDIFEAYPETGLLNGWFVGDLTREEEDNISPFMSPLTWTDKESIDHYWAFYAWHKWREEMNINIEPTVSWPSTLAEIRMRQIVQFYSLHLSHFRIHAEGCELETIKANLALLQKCRPSIDVACYHSRDGLWAIEKALMDGLEDYSFKFRLHAHCGQSAVMYCNPKERS